MMTLPEQVHMALDRLEAAGWEAFVVGGAVRDAQALEHVEQSWVQFSLMMIPSILI